jgi:single-stranded DNA-binding protein
MYINSKGGSVVAGNVTKDPEYKIVGDKQIPLFKLSVAIGRDEQDSAMYADIAAWRNLAEYLNGCGIRKGDPIAAFGTWSKREGNNGKTYWTFNADFISVLGTINSPSGVSSDNAPGESSYDFGEMPDFMK